MIEPDRHEGEGPTQHRAPDRDTVHLTEIHERPGQTVLDEFNGWLAEVVRREASDLHIKVGTPPKIRDAGVLVGTHGFRLRAERVFDMFPHTHHVETLALFTRE